MPNMLFPLELWKKWSGNLPHWDIGVSGCLVSTRPCWVPTRSIGSTSMMSHGTTHSTYYIFTCHAHTVLDQLCIDCHMCNGVHHIPFPSGKIVQHSLGIVVRSLWAFPLALWNIVSVTHLTFIRPMYLNWYDLCLCPLSLALYLNAYGRECSISLVFVPSVSTMIPMILNVLVPNVTSTLWVFCTCPRNHGIMRQALLHRLASRRLWYHWNIPNPSDLDIYCQRWWYNYISDVLRFLTEF